MNKFAEKTQWLIVTLLWFYLFYRAVTIGINQDEAYSYFLVKTNYWRAMPGSLNTHWLNTLSMRLFLWLPGADHVWKLRMLSVFSWWLYAFSAVKLGSVFNNKFLGFAFFLTAVLNPFLLFFFSLGRGYAPACAFILYALWQVYGVIQLRQIKPADWLKVFIPASIAVFANFSSFYFFIALTIVYLIHMLVSGKVTLLVHSSVLKLLLLTAGTSVFAAFSLLFIRYHTRDFDGSQTSDFITSVFSSQIQYANYLTAGADLFRSGFVLFILLVILASGSSFLYSKSKKITMGTYSGFVSIIVMLLNVVFHWLFKTPFEFGRTGLTFYVASLPAFFFMADTLAANQGFSKVAATFISLAIDVVFVLNFCKGYNPAYFAEFPVQTDTEKGLDYLQKSNAREVGLTMWHYSVFNNYYSKAYPDRYTFHTAFIAENLPVSSCKDCDFALITLPDSAQKTVISNWIVKWSNPLTRTMILSKQ